jgi:hypothetical protein
LVRLVKGNAGIQVNLKAGAQTRGMVEPQPELFNEGTLSQIDDKLLLFRNLALNDGNLLLFKKLSLKTNRFDSGSEPGTVTSKTRNQANLKL